MVWISAIPTAGRGMTRAQQDIKRKPTVFEQAEQSGNISGTCRYFGICQDTFCLWKKDDAVRSEEGLINSKPCPKNPALGSPTEIEEKII